jgi:hypothetical protein
MAEQAYLVAGRKAGSIPVRISYRIIELFSDGLYSSPHKAIEELVTNSFDAGAQNVHVILSPDRGTPDSFIAVVDDGYGMNGDGLKQHWLIGVTNKRGVDYKLPAGRKQIGKFGIGKLATFVLSRYFTLVSKQSGKYYATTMDYSVIPQGEEGGIDTRRPVTLPLRELTEQQAKDAVALATNGVGPGYDAIRLFGKGASRSWTVAIMSNLKDLAKDMQKGRLSWILRTAMPLRDDFNLFLDGEALPPSKASMKPLKKWVLGKDMRELPKPAPGGDELVPDENKLLRPEERYGLVHPSLGRITGYAEVYDQFLTGGKSEEIGRSNGFFVYVLGRLINIDDDLFGMPALRHGTFSRFRMVVHVDRLDEELRSSRETVREGPLVTAARHVLHGAFNTVRNWLEEYEAGQEPGFRATGRIAQSAGSLTRRPIIALVEAALKGKADPKYTVFPRNLSSQQRDELVKVLEARAESDAGLVLRSEMTDLAVDQGIAQFHVEAGTLFINSLHPFVAAYRDEMSVSRDFVVLFAMAEVLTEAHLYALGLDPKLAREVMGRRDELLRQFARNTVRRSAAGVARALEDAATDQDRLEEELVEACNCLGLQAVRLGGSKRADGRADGHLGTTQAGMQSYSVSLEAKSKEKADAKVTSKSVDVAAVIQHRDTLGCQHAVVVAPDFPGQKGGQESNLVVQAKADREKSKKTITYIRVRDFARLVRIVSLKCVDLGRLHDLFQNCVSPDEGASWIDKLEGEKTQKRPFKEILETIWALQKDRSFEAVAFPAVAVALEMGPHKLKVGAKEVMEMCRAMQMITSHVTCRDATVELGQNPENVMTSLQAALKDYPAEEKRSSAFKQ